MVRETKEYYLKNKIKFLKQFNIKVDDSILHHIEELYPNQISIDNYCKSLILNHLGDD